MSERTRRVRAIYRKELREYRRNRSLVAGMAILPLIFAINPLVTIFALPASALASCSRTGVNLREGAHHGPQKSTTTGIGAESATRAKSSSDASTSQGSRW